MSRCIRWTAWGMVLVVLALGSFGVRWAPAQAQAPTPGIEVWFFPADELGPALIEYRDAAGTVLASYALASSEFVQVSTGGGYLFARTDDTIGVFNPYDGVLHYFSVLDKPQDTDTEFYTLSPIVPSPSGWFAYTISRVPTQTDGTVYNAIYYADPTYEQVRTIYEAESVEPWFGIEPYAWNNDGSVLLLHEMPQGIGGYILFWTYQNVQAHPLADMQQAQPLGDLDGFADDLSLTALILRDADYVVQGIEVTNVADGAKMTYPLPPLGEPVYAGGNAHFSPSHTFLAYQVARENPMEEKFWTVVVDLRSGQSRVVLENPIGEDWDLYTISGWLDDQKLVLSLTTQGRSYLLDLAANTRTEVPGIFLGYAQGIADVSGFARPGMVYVQCDAPPLSRLVPQSRGRVMAGAGPANVYSWSGYESDVVAQEPEGAAFTVMYGPKCEDGALWWSVRFDDGVEGYVPETRHQAYMLEPWQ